MHKMRKSALILGALFLIFTGCHKVPTPGGDPDDESTFVRVKETPRTWDGNKRAGITYQLLVYSFADRDGDGWGDLGGITDKLDYIDSLGASPSGCRLSILPCLTTVTTYWITPN